MIKRISTCIVEYYFRIANPKELWFSQNNNSITKAQPASFRAKVTRGTSVAVVEKSLVHHPTLTEKVCFVQIGRICLGDSRPNVPFGTGGSRRS